MPPVLATLVKVESACLLALSLRRLEAVQAHHVQLRRQQRQAVTCADNQVARRTNASRPLARSKTSRSHRRHLVQSSSSSSKEASQAGDLATETKAACSQTSIGRRRIMASNLSRLVRAT